MIRMPSTIARHATREEYQLVHQLRLERIGLIAAARHEGGLARQAENLRLADGRALVLQLVPLESLQPFFRVAFDESAYHLPRPLGDGPGNTFEIIVANGAYAAPGVGPQPSYTAYLRQRVFEALWLPHLCPINQQQLRPAMQAWLDWLVARGAHGPLAVVLSEIEGDNSHRLVFEELLQRPVVADLTDLSHELTYAGVRDEPGFPYRHPAR